MIDTRLSSVSMDPAPTWLSIGKASKLLGVNESTLRHWADQKTIRTFRTSGGHRRFALEDLHLIMSQSARPSQARGQTGLRDAALRKIRRRLGRSRAAPSAWRVHISEKQKQRLRPLGRRLLSAASDFLTSRRGRSQVLEEARNIGEEYGTQAADIGMPPEAALEAFLFFRSSLDGVASEIARDQELTAPQAVELCKELNTFTDQVLLSSVRAYHAGSAEEEVLAPT